MKSELQLILRQRCTKIRDALSTQKLDGVILHQPAYIFHLTNWLPPSWANVFLFLSSDQMILVSSFIPDGVSPTWDKVVSYKGFSLEEMVRPEMEAISALLAAKDDLGLRGKNVGVVLQAFPGVYAIPLSESIHLHDVSELIFSVTAVKDRIAVVEIRRREAMLDRAFEQAANIINAGMTEIELFNQLYAVLTTELGTPFTLDCNLASGSRTVTDEPQPTSKVLEKGETILIDLYPNLNGYVADYTRNFVVGQPSEGQYQQHTILEKALAQAEKMLRPGTLVGELDRAVRGVIEQAGYGDFIHQHHTGHAFGLVTPEPPVIIPANPTRLKAGMVIAVEPGIYHPSNGGMRLEGNYLITEDGMEILHGTLPRLTACL
jgi:Xaa-Pro aminopeptidase